MSADLPSLAAALRAVDDTWPAERDWRAGVWRIRSTHGAGKRVSAISLEEAVYGPEDIAQAEAAHRAAGHSPLFMIRPGQTVLDEDLAARGYKVIDPVVIMAAPVTAFEQAEPMRAFAHWPPLALVREIWAEGGIGAGKVAVMERAAAPKTAILGRAPGGIDRASGAAFVSLAGEMAMIHAVEVLPTMRRQGSAHNILRAAANWSQDHGARWLSLVVLAENAPALSLYASLTMQPVGQYHYRSA